MAAMEVPGPSPCSSEFLYYFLNTSSSLYLGIDNVLQTPMKPYASLYKRTPSSQKAHLLLLERWNVPWPLLYASSGAENNGKPKVAVNHVRGSNKVTIKALMVKQLRMLGREHTENAYQHPALPETYLLVPQSQDDERHELIKAHQTRSGPWIAKPTSGAHGDGIRVFPCASEAAAYVDASAAPNDQPAAKEDGAKTKRRPIRPKPRPMWLVQRYVEEPLLYRGNRKFDVRALVCVRHDGKAFWYTDWVARVCGSAFDMAKLDDRYAHITNHCVQVQGEAYGEHEEGNEVFREDVRVYLEESRGRSAGSELFRRIEQGMHEAARDLVAALRENADFSADAPCASFQLLGLDLIATTDGRVLLLEANGSPAVAERMIPEAAEAVVNLALEPLRRDILGLGDGASKEHAKQNSQSNPHFMEL